MGEIVHFADGGENNSDSIRKFHLADFTIYTEISPKEAGQHLHVVHPITIPSANKAEFRDPAFEVTFKTDGAGAWVRPDFLVDSDGTQHTIDGGMVPAAQSATKATINVPKAAIPGIAVLTPGSTIYLMVKGEGDLTETAFVGTVKAHLSLS